MTAINIGQSLQQRVANNGDPYSIGYHIASPGGLGAMTAVGTTSTNGTAIDAKPLGAVGVRLYCSTGESLTYTVATSAPASAPVTHVLTGPATLDEWLVDTAQVYVTAKTGAPRFRWL